MKVKLKFFPLPADLSIIPEETNLLVVDAEDCYYIASRIGDDLEIVASDEEGMPDEIDVRFVAILPDVSEVSDSALNG